MPTAARVGSIDVLYANSIPGFPWFYVFPNKLGSLGLDFGFSANTPLIYNWDTADDVPSGDPFNISYINLNVAGFNVETTNVNEDDFFRLASWDNAPVSGVLYGVDTLADFRYPGDLFYTGGPYIQNINDVHLSDPTDEAIFQAGRPENCVPVPTYAGFIIAAHFSFTVASRSGPVFFFIDPTWSTYRRIVILGLTDDTNAIFWCDKYNELNLNADGPLSTIIYDGSSYWFGLRAMLSGGTDTGPFPLLQISIGNNPGGFFPFPITPPIPPPGTVSLHLTKISGGRSLGPAILGSCCIPGPDGMISQPMYPTASGIR